MFVITDIIFIEKLYPFKDTLHVSPTAPTAVRQSTSTAFESEDLNVPDISSYETSITSDVSIDDPPTSSSVDPSPQHPVPSTPPVVHTEAIDIFTLRHSTRVSRPPIWVIG